MGTVRARSAQVKPTGIRSLVKPLNRPHLNGGVCPRIPERICPVPAFQKRVSVRRVHRKRSVITESWHDHHQWWSRVFEEPDLQPLSQLWAESSEEELAQAESVSASS